MFIVIFTNCQGPMIWNNYLKNLDFFKNCTCKIISVLDNAPLDIESFTTCDIFLYQFTTKYMDVSISDNQNVLNLLKPDCIKICFPSMYIDIWPLYQKGSKDMGSYTVTNLKAMGYPLETLLILYDNGLFSFDLKNRFTKSFRYLQEREEKYCNIKLSQFILENYQNYRLFDTQFHPTGILASYAAKQICEFLKIEYPVKDIFADTYQLDLCKWPDTVYTVKELGVKYMKLNYHDWYKEHIIRIYNSNSVPT